MEVNLDLEDEHSEEEANRMVEDPGSDEEPQQFDITLAASHSYMGSGLREVGGRSVLEAGWQGRVPALPHHGAVFPGETVPMLINDARDAAIIARTIQTDKLFGLLCPDETGQLISGYGVVCEVFEALMGDGSPPSAVTFKARAVHRFRLMDPADHHSPIDLFRRVKMYHVRVLPERGPAPPLLHARLASLDNLRTGDRQHDSLVRTLDAAVTPWPGFVYNIFDYKRMRNIIRDYFRSLGLDHLMPAEAVSLSFWVASNLPLGARDRLALLLADDALQRLHAECALIARDAALCCVTCGAEVARTDHVFAMSSEGAHSNYTNVGGFVHDVVTVTRATNVATAGAASAEYSWFPGYAWRVAVCAGCAHHVGWRFTALRRTLRPHSFYGLCRNYVAPRDPHDPRDPPAP